MLSKEAAEIDDIRVIRENDHLYVINEEKFVSAPQGASPTSLSSYLDMLSGIEMVGLKDKLFAIDVL